MVRNSDYQSHILANNEGEVIWKSRQVHPSPTLFTESPQQRMLDYRGASVLHLVPKPSAKTKNLGLVVASNTLNLSLCLGGGTREQGSSVRRNLAELAKDLSCGNTLHTS